MIVGIHQPHFLPWLGYFNKAWQSQIFVWLNTVQYRKNYYQNRTKIKNVNDLPLWLTLPVHAHLGTNIDTVYIADARWRERIQKTIEHCYHKTPFFNGNWPILALAIQESLDNLDQANFKNFQALLEILGAKHVQIVRASDIAIQSCDPTGRLVEICQYLGADAYIAGQGGRNYLDVEQFDRVGIKVIWQAFNADEVVYTQLGQSFLGGLSIIDCLFNAGPEKTREILQTVWKP